MNREIVRMPYQYNEQRSGEVFNQFLSALDGNNLKSFRSSIILIPHLPQTYKHRLTSVITQDYLPQYAQDFDINRFRLAVCFCFTDSRNLDPKTRERIGLTPNPQYINSAVKNVPHLFSPFSTRIWGNQCSDAENGLLNTENVISGYSTKYDTDHTPVEFIGCLAGKLTGIISGVCFETTEFSNGKVFIEGIWYMLRDLNLINLFKNIIPHLGKVAKFTKEQRLKAPYSHMDNVVIDQGVIDFEHMGGVWQPTRPFYQMQEIDITDNSR